VVTYGISRSIRGRLTRVRLPGTGGDTDYALFVTALAELDRSVGFRLEVVACSDE